MKFSDMFATLADNARRMEFKDRLDYVRAGRRHTDQWRAPRTPDGHDVSEGDRYVDRAVLHVDPSEIVARITDEFADRGVAEGDACSDAGLTTADACSEPVDVVDGHGSLVLKCAIRFTLRTWRAEVPDASKPGNQQGRHQSVEKASE